jgi:hypothetical protein
MMPCLDRPSNIDFGDDAADDSSVRSNARFRMIGHSRVCTVVHVADFTRYVLSLDRHMKAETELALSRPQVDTVSHGDLVYYA